MLRFCSMESRRKARSAAPDAGRQPAGAPPHRLWCSTLLPKTRKLPRTAVERIDLQKFLKPTEGGLCETAPNHSGGQHALCEFRQTFWLSSKNWGGGIAPTRLTALCLHRFADCMAYLPSSKRRLRSPQSFAHGPAGSPTRQAVRQAAHLCGTASSRRALLPDLTRSGAPSRGGRGKFTAPNHTGGAHDMITRDSRVAASTGRGRSVRYDPISRWESADTETMRVVYSSGSGRGP